MIRALASPLLAVLVCLLGASAASAEFTGAKLLSGTPQLQFQNASAPAMSADGRYVVFQGVLDDVPGIYRRDLQSETIEEVVGGNPADPSEPCASTEADPFAACDAAGPSISANGQYIAFTTTADLQPEGGADKPPGEPASDAGCPEVYVRNMGTPDEPLAASAPGAYTLASALNETGTGISFSACPSSNTSRFAPAGAQAAAGVALSTDGRHVVFTVLSTSNLARGPHCALPTPLSQCPPETPPSQVAVRDLEPPYTTTLVSVTPTGQPTPAGGAFPSSESEESPTVNIPEFAEYGDQPTGSSAAISADASTVAWMGTNVPEQVPSATDVTEHGLGLDPPQREAEPLWRRIEGPDADETKRLLAGAGLDFYFVPGTEVGSALPVFDGSFLGAHGSLFIPPALSADGRTVALVANAPSPASEGSWEYAGLPWPDADAYAVYVPEGAASVPQVTPLTATPDFAAGATLVRSVKDVAISADGNRVAFDTARSQLLLPSLAFASPPFSNLGFHVETFEANLALGTLQRVTSTYNGAEPNGNASLLSFSGDGQQLALASSATNLFFGDGVPSSEVYLVSEAPSGSSPAPQEVGVPAPGPTPSLEWTLSATASAQADGSVLVQAQVPGAGRLSATAGAQLPATAAAKPKARARRADTARDQRGSTKHAGTKRPGKTPTVPLRTVAQAAMTADGPSLLQLRLHVLSRYRSLLTKGLGLYTIVRISFTAAGHAPLVREIPVSFQIVAKVKKHTTQKSTTPNTPTPSRSHSARRRG
jgi:WD40-like Beta Propeller Repeat